MSQRHLETSAGLSWSELRACRIVTAAVLAWSSPTLAIAESAAAASRPAVTLSVEQTLQLTAAAQAQLQCPAAAPAGVLQLSEAVLRVLCTDPKTRSSWAALRAEQAEVRVRRAARWPSASASVEWGREVTRERDTDGNTQRSGGVASALGVQLQWVLWDFGLQSSRESAAEQAMLAAAAGHDQTLQETLLDVVQAYLNLAEAQGSVKLILEAESFARDLLAQALRPPKEGAESLDVLGEKQARTALFSRTLDLRRAEGNLARAHGQLALLMGVSPQSVFTVEMPSAADANGSAEPSWIELVDAAVQAYPALREARSKLAAAQAELDETRRSDLPTVLAFAGQQRSRTATVPGQSNRTVGVRVEIPLGSWRDRRHRIQRAQAQLEVANQAVRKVRKDVELEVWLSYQTVRENIAALRVAEQLREVAEDLLQAELKAFRAGDSDMFEVLDADSSRTDAANSILSIVSTLTLARVRLAASLGQLARQQLPAALAN